MVLRQMLKFRIECDGYHPRGYRCTCDIVLEAPSRAEAEAQAKSYGWYEDHRGWLCNALSGHRDDRPKVGTFHVGGDQTCYYEWRVKGYARWWQVIRRRNGEPQVVGEHLTLGQAYAAMDADRMLVLSDPLAIEFKQPEIRLAR